MLVLSGSRNLFVCKMKSYWNWYELCCLLLRMFCSPRGTQLCYTGHFHPNCTPPTFRVVLIYLKFGGRGGGLFFYFGISKGKNKKGLFTSPLQ